MSHYSNHMKIHEAFQIIFEHNKMEKYSSTTLWARPVHWKDSGCALIVDGHGKIYIGKDALQQWNLTYGDIIADWETLTSKQLFEEYEKVFDNK